MNSKTKNSFSLLVYSLTALLLACAHSTPTIEKAAIPPAPAPESKVTHPPPTAAPQATSSEPLQTTEPTAATTAAKPTPPAMPPRSPDLIWTLKSGKLQGPGQTTAKLLGKSRDAKSGQVATSTCFKYEDFAIEEVRATGEMGAAEINLRRPSAPDQSLCLPDFKGKVRSLPAIEGFLAGVVGDYAIIEGADFSEGDPQFQIISLKTLKQVFKNRHDPRQELKITKNGDKISVTFFAPMSVKCELAREGAECWKKVLELNGVTKPAPPPNCKSAFNKANVALEESAIVTMLAQIQDIESPKIEFLGGNSNCKPVKD